MGDTRSGGLCGHVSEKPGNVPENDLKDSVIKGLLIFQGQKTWLSVCSAFILCVLCPVSHEKGRALRRELGTTLSPPRGLSAASEEYYQLLTSSENHPCSAHVPSYTVHEIEGVTSELIVKNVVST